MSRLASYIVAGIIALSLIAMLPVASNAAVSEPVVVPQVQNRGTTASYVIASAHNYANSYTYTWPTKTVTGATQIRVHFTKIDVESNYDYVYVLTSTGTQVNKYTGLYSSGVWSSWITGNSFKVKLTTDSSVVKWGFATDLVEYVTGSSDTTAPTVSVTAPTAGATVSGTTTISASASDNVGVTSVGFYVGTTLLGTDTSSPYSYSWATTSYTNGAYSLSAKAYDAAGNVGTSASVSVTVSNTVVDDGGLLTAGVTANGNMDSTDGADMWWIDVPSGTTSMYVVLGIAGTGDFDDYGKFNAQPTTSSYDWRGYTSGGEENTVTSPSVGRHYIMVDYYSGSGAYTLKVTFTTGGGGGGAWGTGGKYAIIVGISNYQSINDLSFCDEDALDWYNFLTSKGYECHVFYDGSYTSNSFTSIPAANKLGYATEATVRAAIQGLAAYAVSGNQIAFVTSGHGSGDGAGSSYLCMYDCSGSTGCYYDTELKADFNLFATGVKMFVFVDHCYSGGLGPEMLTVTNKANLYMTTTCTANGYGYDDPDHSNGAWTYYFLENYLVGHSTSSMEAVFDATSPGYPYTGGDAPMEFDGATSTAFYL
jgi:hypothetical protein